MGGWNSNVLYWLLSLLFDSNNVVLWLHSCDPQWYLIKLITFNKIGIFKKQKNTVYLNVQFWLARFTWDRRAREVQESTWHIQEINVIKGSKQYLIKLLGDNSCARSVDRKTIKNGKIHQNFLKAGSHPAGLKGIDSHTHKKVSLSPISSFLQSIYSLPL